MTKKIKISVYLAVFVFFFVSGSAHAESGTCSWHGGINCSAGSDWDGSAICNDGWRDSTERYATAQICRVNNCTPPPSGCTSEGEYAKLQSDLIRGGSMRYAQESAQGLLSVCRSAITAYQSYQSCLANSQNSYNLRIQAQEQDLKSQLERLTKQKEEETRKREDDIQNISCKNLNGQFAHFDSNYRKCFCDKDYTYSDGQCRSVDSVCQNRIGGGARASWAKDVSGSDIFSCECNTGYALNASGKCEVIPKPTAKISERALNVAKSGSEVFLCQEADLSDQEKSECGSYRLHSNLYDWQIYNKSVEVVEKPSVPVSVSPTPVPVSPTTPTPVPATVTETKTPVVSSQQKVEEPKKVIQKPVAIKKEPPKTEPKSNLVAAFSATTTQVSAIATSTTATSTSVKKDSLLRGFLKRLKFWTK